MVYILILLMDMSILKNNNLMEFSKFSTEYIIKNEIKKLLRKNIENSLIDK